MNDIDELFANQTLELRRGTIVLAILSCLKTPLYGYGLLQTLEQSGIAVDAGTLYPLLRRLEKQGVLESNWNTDEQRPRKFYQLSPQGTKLYDRLVEEWSQTNEKLQVMIKQGESHE
ncbi:MAG TPA: PadR family transcriptional regulator [Candidatus Saccharimonadales bacterium]|nr:PadR family transcriptional regulator [Candidatus Saccharimonadales bacterium]